ncbi:MAG TPA: GntR family transcriptional regulator [Propionibacteriaceae bacterium]|nr:GntR family transcriptional regulator [Propionibacteriaceae bacterium]
MALSEAVQASEPAPDHRLRAPSLVKLAADSIRKMILAGDFAPGQRLLEERLTAQLAISRPPLREALRILENEGLITTLPRRGSTVTTLTDRDVFEILTLRSALERMAFELGIPVTRSELLDPSRAALLEMERCAAEGDRGALVLAGYAFHSALIEIADHRRLVTTYASVQQQLLLCMARNLIVREQFYEDLEQHAARHRVLLEAVESGDRDRALAELSVHGERSFEKLQASRPPERPSSMASLDRGAARSRAGDDR